MDHARSEAVISHSVHRRNQSPRRFRLSPLNQLSQEDHLHSDRLATDEFEPVHPLFDTDTFDKDRRQEDEKQEVGDGNSQLNHSALTSLVVPTFLETKTSSLLAGLDI
jgi:hypothetical protein